MMIKTIIFSILLNGSAVKKEYYFQENEIIILYKYFNENEEFLDEQVIYYVNGDSFVTVLEGGMIYKKTLAYFENDSWSRSDKTYEVKEEIEKVSDSKIKKVKTMDETVETTIFRKLDFEVNNIRLVNEIIAYSSTYYLTESSETVFNGNSVFSLNLEEIRFDKLENKFKFSEYRNKIESKERN